MRRSQSIAASIVLVALVAAIALRFHPRAAFDALPELPRLVENEQPPTPPDGGPAAAPFSPWLGAGLLAFVLVATLARGRASNPWRGAIALAIVAVHPSVWIAMTTARGVTELGATAIAVLGAALCARERPVLREIGAGLLVVGAWLSPAGVGVAAFAIAIATSGALRAFVALAVLPRVFGTPGIADALGLNFTSVDASVSAAGFAAGFESAGATLAGGSASAWMSGGAGIAVATLGAVAALLLAATAAHGARIAALAACCGTAVLGYAASGSTLVATAAFVPLVLTLALAAARPRDESRARVASFAATLVLLGLGAYTTWHCVWQATQAEDLFACEAAELGGARPLAHRAALLALERSGKTAVQAELARRAAEAAEAADRERSLDAASVRDLAVLAAQFGLADEALPLLERSVRGAGPRGSIEPSAAELDLLDLKLRAGRPRVVLREIDEMKPEALADASLAADLFVRRATALALLSLSSKFEPDREARSEHASAMFSAYTDALARDPEHVRALLDRGVALRATGRGIDAMKDFEKAAKLRPDLAAPHLELAKLYFSRGEGEAGEREITAATRARGRSDPDVILVLSQLLVARGDLVNSAQNARALESMQHRLRGGGEELAALYTQLGAAADNARDESLAFEMASKARALGADASGENAARVARILRQRHDYERELAVLRDAELHDLPVQDLREQIVGAYKNFGYARLLANDQAGACAAFLDAAERAADLDELGALPELIRKLAGEIKGPTSDRVLTVAKLAYAKAQDESKSERWRGAEAAYRVSLALLPQNPYAWFQLGEALAAQKRPQDAIEAWTKAKELGELLVMSDVVVRATERLKTGP